MLFIMRQLSCLVKLDHCCDNAALVDIVEICNLYKNVPLLRLKNEGRNCVCVLVRMNLMERKTTKNMTFLLKVFVESSYG